MFLISKACSPGPMLMHAWLYTRPIYAKSGSPTRGQQSGSRTTEVPAPSIIPLSYTAGWSPTHSTSVIIPWVGNSLLYVKEFCGLATEGVPAGIWKNVHPAPTGIGVSALTVPTKRAAGMTKITLICYFSFTDPLHSPFFEYASCL